MKVIFMGTPDFSVPTLEKLHQEGFEIPLVITQTDKPKGRGKKLTPPPVKVKAKELGIRVYQPENINDKESINLLKELSPDVIVVIAYGQILKEDILNLPKYGCINVHASLLPKYRGAAPINWVIINGEEKTGITTMLMDKGLDTGDMLLKSETNIGQNEVAGDLHDRLMILGSKLLIETLNSIDTSLRNKTPQDNDLATYAPIMNKSLGKINWNKPGEVIRNLVRGTDPWPSAYTTYKNKKVKIYDVIVIDKFKEGVPGEIVKVDSNGIYVNTISDCLQIKEIQFPGKRKMKVSDFLKGNNIEKAVVLI